MESPKKRPRTRKLVRSLTENCKVKESHLRKSSMGRRKEDYNVVKNSGASPSKTLHSCLQVTSNNCSISSHSLDERSDSADLFHDSMDSLNNLETNNTVSLPLKTASLLATPMRHLQLENNDSSVLQPLDPNDVSADENLPATQPAAAFILSSVVVYVEVRAGGDNRTRLVMRELRNLGATVVETFRKNVTHIVFREGKLSTYKLAVERSVHMVSAQWINECRKAKKLVPEHLYPPHDLEYYKDPAKHKMIKRVKSFQPDYDMDQEQRMKRVRQAMKRKRKRLNPCPVTEVTYEYVPIEEEYEIEHEFMRRLIHTKMERHQSPGACSLARGLVTIAGPIDPTFNDYIQRSVSPTSSEEDMIPVPLAVKLMRRIKTPQQNSSAKMSKQLISDQSLNSSNEDNNIEAAMAQLFRESSDSDCSDIILNNNFSCQVFTTKTPHCFATRPIDSDAESNAGQPPAKLRKMEAARHPALETTDVAIDNLPCTPEPTVSQRAVRKLFNVPRLHDSPVLILPSSSDSESSQQSQRNKMQHKTLAASPVVDMDITSCIGNAILDDPSSLRTKSARKKERINSRRSSGFFAPPKPKPNAKTNTKFHTLPTGTALPTIVCSSLNHEEVEVIKGIAKELGGFEVEDKVTRKTTHIVSLDTCTRRTVNILRGIARGCWIVKKMWALKSLEAGRWIAEDEFEWTDFSPAVQLCRYERMAFSPFYRPDFFGDCGLIFVSKTAKPRKDLYELVGLCGGKITFSTAMAKIIVGESGHNKSTAYVTVPWILDTIQAAELKPITEYKIQT